MTRLWTADDLATLSDMFARGVKWYAMQTPLQRSRSTIQRMAYRLGLRRFPRDADRREKVRVLHGEGLNDGEIAKRLGCTRACVRKNRVALGLPVRSKRGGEYDLTPETRAVTSVGGEE